jgi:hypothetical protein
MASSKVSTPAKMIHDAFDLFEVAVAASVRRLEEKEFIPSSTTSFFLIGSSLELALLCYLSHKGFASEQLLSINHDLEVALQQANELGLKQIADLSDDFFGSVKQLNADFKFQNIQDATINSTHSAIFSSLQGGTQHLLSSIASEIGQNQSKAA